MIGRRKAQVRSLEKRIAELSERVHTLEQHRRVQLNRTAMPATMTPGLLPIPPGFLREGWPPKPYPFGGAIPEDVADHAPAGPNPYGHSEDLR